MPLITGALIRVLFKVDIIQIAMMETNVINIRYVLPTYKTGPNPTIVSYNASVVKIYSATGSLVNKLAFFAQNKAKLCKNWIITLVFEKNDNFFAKN
jgi:hypothetical protein